MFGLFKKKKFSFKCPMCSRTYGIKFDPEDITDFSYEYKEDFGVVGRDKCGFCKIEMTVLLSKSGEIEAVDEKWEKVEFEHYQMLNPIEDEIMGLEDQLDEDKDNENIKKKIAQLEKKKEKLEESFEKKEEKYHDRQCNWEEKWQNKLEKM